MVKIGKKIVYLSMHCILGVAHVAAMQLRVVSAQGTPLKKVAAGAPCLVELVIPSSAELKQRPVIPGLEKVAVLRTQESSQIFIVNGKQRQEKTLGYYVRFSEPGTYALGPVRVSTAQGELVSNQLAVTVEEAASTASDQHEHTAFARWQFEKKSAYVGEAIPFSLKFYYTNNDITALEPVPFSLPDARLVVQEAGVGSFETVGGVTYQVREWRGQVYVHKAGEFSAPPVTFEYAEPNRQQDDRFGFMFMQLLGGSLLRKQLQAPGKKLMIKNMPVTTETIAGVGVISGLQAELTAQSAQAGAPVKFTLSVTGKADMEGLAAPALTVPDAIKAYFSRATVSPQTQQGVQTKTWEYVIQGLAAGAQTIPAQKLVFFNPEKESYEAFTTQPVTLEISGSIETQVAEETGTIAETPVQEQGIPEEAKAVILPEQTLLIDTGALPWIWFWVLMLLILSARIKKKKLVHYGSAWKDYLKKRWVLYRMRMSLKKADAYTMYRVMRQGTEKIYGEFPVFLEPAKEWHARWDSLTAAAFSDNNRAELAAAEDILRMIRASVSAPWRMP